MDEAQSEAEEFSVSTSDGGDAHSSEETINGLTLDELNKETGQNFKSVDDFLRSWKEKEQFIGGLGELKDKAKRWDEQESKKNVDPQQKIQEEYNPGGRIDKMEFRQIHPEAASVIDEVAAMAKSEGRSMSEVYKSSSLKRFVEKERKEQEAKNPDYVESGQRLVPGRTGFKKEDFNKLSLEEQRKVVSKFKLGKGSPFPKGVYQSSKKWSND